MQIKVFSVPALGDNDSSEALNKFLRGNKILQVEQALVEHPAGSYWSFCIRYSLGKVELVQEKESVDYKNVLDEKSFTRFTIMRKIRKQLAEEAGMPAFAVFTNKELSELAQVESLSEETMKSIKGIGDKKLQRFGEKFLSLLAHEKGEKTTN